MGLQTFDEKTPFLGIARLLDTDGLAAVVLAATPAYPTRVDAILCSNLDTIAHVVVLEFQRISTVVYVGSFSVPAGTGTGGLPSVDLLHEVLPATVGGLLLTFDITLYARCEVACNAGKGIHFSLLGGTV